MSTIEVKIVKVEIRPHPGADRLELAYIDGEGGYISVVKKDQFKTGDLAIYIPIDSVVPDNIRTFLKEENKIDVKDGRIRCAKIRQVFSEGLCLSPDRWVDTKYIKEGMDLTSTLGIIKYEPPPPQYSSGIRSARGVNFNYENPNFPEYWDVEHLKKYPRALQPDEEVVATIKWHGTNFRCGYVRRPHPKGPWNKIKSLFENEFEYLVGSHERIKKLSKNAIKYGARDIDTYWRAADKYNLEYVTTHISTADGAKDEVVIYAEIIGKGIQKGYDYGISDGDIEIRVFDIMVNRKYLNWDKVKQVCYQYGLPIVQEAYRGPWHLDVRDYANATDEYNGRKFVREGVVIRPVVERKDPHCGRVILKYISEAYALDKTNSEYH